MPADSYNVRFHGARLDPYRVALLFDLDPVVAQAVKKLLRCGSKHKDKATDIREAITTLERWEEIAREDEGIANCADFEVTELDQ